MDLEELTVEYVDSEDFFNFEEGWTADILDPNLSEEVKTVFGIIADRKHCLV